VPNEARGKREALNPEAESVDDPGWRQRRRSSLRDVATVCLYGDCTWLRAPTTAGVQAVDRGDLCGRQLEVEHVDVFSEYSRVSA